MGKNVQIIKTNNGINAFNNYGIQLYIDSKYIKNILLFTSLFLLCDILFTFFLMILFQNFSIQFYKVLLIDVGFFFSGVITLSFLLYWLYEFLKNFISSVK